jgi:hypothetical protein
MPVLDMTTFEFLNAVAYEEIEDQLYNRLKGFLEYADLVKFAKLVPEPEKPENDYEEAVDIIDYIRQIELSKEAPPGEAVPASVIGEQNV